MFGGFKGAGSALAITIAGVGLFGASPVLAADLGGDCCADLEERVAELEATTARKGNRKVKLTISGFVNEAVLWWDDGRESNAYVVTNETSQDRFRFLGEAEITKGWTAGYLLEIGARGAREDRVSQLDDNGGTSANQVSVRHSAWYIGGKEYGKVWVGQTSNSTDGITEINLANTSHFSYANSWGNTFGDGGSGFNLRRKDGTLVTSLQWGDFVAQGAAQATPGEGHRYNVVKYDSPTFAGFTFSAAWGEDDIWDVALRYKGEFSGFKLAAGIGYGEQNDFNSTDRRGVGATEEIGLSASILHSDTGLYASGAWGRLTDDGLDDLYGRNVDEDTKFYTIQAGIERKFFSLGKTTLYGEYFDLERGAGYAVNSSNVVSVLSAAGLGTGLNQVDNSRIQGWGFGVNQNLNEVIDIYLAYKHVDIDVTTTNGAGAFADADLEAIQFVTGGALIKF